MPSLNNKLSAKKIALLGVILSLSLIIGAIEHMLPPILPPLPFARIGFSNIVVLFCLLTLGVRAAFLIALFKSILVPLFLGNPMMMLYSLPSSCAALAISCLLLYVFSVGLPIAGIISAMTHNLIQIFVAFLILKSPVVFGYLPYLLAIASLSGAVVGIIVHFVIKYLPKVT